LGQEAVAGTGYTFFITDGYRSMDEQARLYAQGRTVPGKIVTMAKPGQSPHNYGLAVDCSFQKNGKLEYRDNLYAKVYPIARKLGLELGADWTTFKDKPHFEYKGWKALKDKEMAVVPQPAKPVFKLYPHRINVEVGKYPVNVRTGPATTYPSLGEFAAQVAFAAQGFCIGEEVAGNNIWWVTLDERFVWSGATTSIPKVPAVTEQPTEKKDDQIQMPISQKEESENKISFLESTITELTRSRDEWQTQAANLQKEILQQKSDYQNFNTIKNSVAVLQADIESYRNKNVQLKKDLEGAYAKAFSGFFFFEVPVGWGRYRKLVSLVIKLLNLFATGMTQTHVIAIKENARVYSAQTVTEVATAFEGVEKNN